MEWEATPNLDYSATGDDIDSASQKIIAMFNDVYDKLNRLRTMDASADHGVGDAAPYSFKIDTSVDPPALLMRKGDNTGYVQIGSLTDNMGVTADNIGGIQGEGMGKLSMGRENELPSTATTYDMYFAHDTRRLWIYLTGAWRVFLSLNFEDMLHASDNIVEASEVALSGANKIPRLNSVGQGEFNITGSAHKLGGKDLYLPEIQDNQVLVFNAARNRWEAAPRDEITEADVSATGEPNKIVKTDAQGAAHVDITGSAARIATKAVDLHNLQNGETLVYDATHGTFVNKGVATVNEDGVVNANISGSAAKWSGKKIQTIGMEDGQILVWSEANQAFINRNQGSIGTGKALVINQDGDQKANYNGDAYRNINIVTPHLRVASYEYHVGDVVFSKALPHTQYLECTTAGVTQAVEPTYEDVAVGGVIADGGVEWTLREFAKTTTTDALQTDVNALQADVIALQTDGTRRPSTTYAVKDIRYYSDLPPGWYLECSVAGTTDSGAITMPSPVVENASVVDGTVTWKIRKISSADGVPIATILAYSSNGDLPSGYLLCDGSAVSRTMFPDLFAAIGTTYGSGDGSTTFNLPDYNTAARFAQGSTVAGVEKEAGLPNITGRVFPCIPNAASDTTGTTMAIENTPGTGALNPGGNSKRGYYPLGGMTTNALPGGSINLDASRSNPIYGNSDTVQPESLTVRYIIKAFDGQTADSALIDITQYVQRLEEKADINGSNLVHHRDVITTSGTYTAPVTALYKITVKGGGAGGGGGLSTASTARSGYGGGEGGTTIAYERLMVGDVATIVIGAGGTGGAAGGTGGAAGGNSTVTANGHAYTGGGAIGIIGGEGTIYGAPGGNAEITFGSGGSQISAGSSGGGSGGGYGSNNSAGHAGTQGGGGGGGSAQLGSTTAYYAGGAGGDGYVWFEYYTPGA